MPGQPSDIPVGTQFSPALINLEEFLKAIIDHSGNKPAMIAAIWAPPVHLRRTVPESTRNASLPLEAAAQYGLLEGGTYVVTPLARELANLSGQDLKDAFARHILQTLGGLRVVEAAEEMRLDKLAGLSQENVTGDSLAHYLSNQGFRVNVHNTAINTLRMWLAEAGVFGNRPGHEWEVDRTVVERLIGVSPDAIAILVSFSDGQRAFAKALCHINPVGWHSAAAVRDLAEAVYGVHLGRASLPNEVLEPLKRAGLIDYRTRGTSGGKTSELITTDAFKAQLLEPFVTTTVKTLDPELTSYYQKRPADIYAGLNSPDTFTKGQALEAYAIHIMRLLGLRFRGWRKRAADATGRAEIDALFTGLFGGIPTLWQVQCKNTPGGKVDLEDVAKEVGLVPITQTTHIMLIANAPITADAKDYAYKIMRSSALTIFLLEKQDFDDVQDSPGALGRILRNKSEEIISVRSRTSTWSR